MRIYSYMQNEWRALYTRFRTRISRPGRTAIGILLALTIAGCGSDSRTCHLCSLTAWGPDTVWGYSMPFGQAIVFFPSATVQFEVTRPFPVYDPQSGTTTYDPGPIAGADITVYAGLDSHMIVAASNRSTVLAINMGLANYHFGSLAGFKAELIFRGYDNFDFSLIDAAYNLGAGDLTADILNGIWHTKTDDHGFVEAVPVVILSCPAATQAYSYSASSGLAAAIEGTSARWNSIIQVKCG